MPDKTGAFRHTLIQAKESPEYIRMAEEIKVRAERRAGGLLKEMPKATPGVKPRNSITSYDRIDIKLSDIGITRDQSSNWQRIASIPEDI